MLSDLLSLFVSTVVVHETEGLEGSSGAHVETLDSFGKSGNDGFDLADVASAPNSDVDVQQTSVLSYDEWCQDSLPLHGQEERLQQRLAVDVDDTSSWLHLSQCPRSLPLSIPVRPHLRINFGLSRFHGQIPSEVEQVELVEFGVVVNV